MKCSIKHVDHKRRAYFDKAKKRPLVFESHRISEQERKYDMFLCVLNMSGFYLKFTTFDMKLLKI